VIDLVAYIYNSACRVCFADAKPMQGGCCAEGACNLKPVGTKQVDETLDTRKLKDTN
jgi:hypothetical protein|tara:strand:- start:1146 stop:1316 length:171 start_codon:yes stop_codon:yes gene_type:complete